jgi:Family of unknown function (DUF5675)
MKWKLWRKEYREDGIFGELVSEDGVHTFQTLEHAYKVMGEIHPNSVEYAPKIPEGPHRFVLYKSPKHGMVVPLLDDILDPNDQDRKFELHIGNYNEDSDGCILVGLGLGNRANGGKMLTSSKQAFDQIMKLGVSEIEVIGVT